MSNDLFTLNDVRKLIQSHPIIDHHAHNLNKINDLRSEDLLALSSEATGQALQDTRTALPHLRAKKQLCQLLNLPTNSKWEDIVSARTAAVETDSQAYIRQCFSGTQTLLIDDGFDDQDALEPYDWHSNFTTTPCKRIVRIDAGAEAILTAIYAALSDNEVAAFKSGICFTTGLAIQPFPETIAREQGFTSFQSDYLPNCTEENFAINYKSLNDYLVLLTCNILTETQQSSGRTKPLQFHCGFAGADTPILTSNTAHLQHLIQAFPSIPFILLHASYPYTREAALLTSLNANCYLDLSAVFPEIARHGQEAVLRQCFEMVPYSKLLWSTDGHSQPETFWLANLQGRAALGKVLCEFVTEGDLTVEEAIEAAKGILFENANRLYDLALVAQVV